MKEKKARWYSIVYIICLGLLISSLPFNMLFENQLLVFGLNSTTKLIAITIVLYNLKKEHFKTPSIPKMKSRDVIFIPILLLCFSNYFVVLLQKNIVINPLEFSNIAMGITTCLLTACLEELLFRHILLNELLESHSKVKAIIISSITFGAVHLLNIGSIASIIPALIQMLYTAFLGLFLGIIYSSSKNISYPIIMHFAFNFFNGYLIDKLFKFEMNITYFIINILIGLIVLLYGYFLYKTKEE